MGQGKDSSVNGDRASGGVPVVGVGASAGGLDAFRRFLEALPVQTGAAFVLVQHLDPTHESLMAGLLSRSTSMTVKEITDGEAIEANTVFVIPPDRYVTVKDGRLVLTHPSQARGKRMAVDELFRSIAEELGRRAIGVVLSGTGTDGTMGLRAIKAAGGLAIAQDPATAAHPGMPRSATDQNLADLTLEIAAMPAAIARFIAHPYSRGESNAGLVAFEIDERDEAEEADPAEIGEVISIVRDRIGLDLDAYKRSTLVRRVHRRMGLRHADSLGDYVALLNGPEGQEELEELARDVHINVTDFFRDTEAFASLEKNVIPRLYEAAVTRPAGDRTIRVWTPGCASGEEAYSIAISLLEGKRKHAGGDASITLQLFATDIDDEAVQAAREGVFSESSVAHLGEARRDRYFFEMDELGLYRVRPFVRDMITFASHDLLGDPPFSKIDLVSCRNLLIYLRQEGQRRAMQVFHFALRQNGYLFLGTSEGISSQTRLFRTVDKKWRIYQRLDNKPQRTLPQFQQREARTERSGRDERSSARSSPPPIEALIAAKCAPPTAVTDHDHRVLYLSGDLIEFLDLPRGSAEPLLTEMLREELRTRVRSAMYRAAREDEEVVAHGRATARDGTPMSYEATVRRASSADLGDSLLLVSFRRLVETPSDDQPVNQELAQELEATRADLQATVAELENANEELRASNEEASTMNEELQSSNEELETQSEELRSVNEELTTLNQQLREKIDEVQEAHADIANLFASVKLPAIFLDKGFCIRRYTPEARKLLNVIEADIGRPLRHLTGECIDDGLHEAAAEVLDTLAPLEAEVRTSEGAWYLRRILPYRTEDDRIAGVVVTFADVTRLRQLSESLSRQQQQQAQVIDLGLAALREQSIKTIALQASRSLSAKLGAPLVKVLQMEEGGAFSILAGVGWDDRAMAGEVVPGSRDSQAGYTLERNEPVVVQDLPNEPRFRGPELLLRHGVKSGVSVVLHGPEGRAFGVLGVHDTERRKFDQNDVNFVQQVANVLAGAIQRRHAEQEVAEREDRFRAMADNIAQLAWMADESGWIFWYNRRWFDFTGTTLDAMEGWGWQSVHHPEHLERVLKRFRGCVEAGVEWEDTFPLRGADGAYRWFLSRARPIRNANGKIRLWFGTNTDITEQLETERKLHESRETLQAIIDNAPAAVYAKDFDGRYVLSNTRHAEVLGSVPEKVIGMTDADFATSAAGAAEYQANDRRVWESGRSIEVEELVPAPDGDRVFLTLKFPLRASDGSIYAVCGVSPEITQRKRDERHLQTVMGELNHRVKNTLAVIQSITTQTAKHATTVDGFTANLVERLRSMGDAHALLTKSDWYGAELRSILEAELLPRIGEPGQLALEGPSITLRPKTALALHMVIHELATNASKYGALATTDGRLRIRWRFDTSDTPDDTARIEWVERGVPNIDREKHEGFGLRMIHEVLEYELGGSIERRFEAKGFECSIRLPLRRIAAAGVLSGEANANSAGGVLIVEDSLPLATQLVDRVRDAGYPVVGPVATVDAALRLLENSTCTAALLDVDLDGDRVFPVARRVEELGAPYAFVTGYDTSDLPPEFRDVTFFSKPMDFDRVRQWLDEQVDGLEGGDSEEAARE